MWRKLRTAPARTWWQSEELRATTAGETSLWFANEAVSRRDGMTSPSPRPRNRPESFIFLLFSSLILPPWTTGLCAADSSIRPHPLMEDYNAAWELEGQGNVDEAIPRLEAIIAKDKTFWRAYGPLAQAYAARQQLDR